MRHLLHLFFLLGSLSSYSQIHIHENINSLQLNEYAQSFLTKDTSITINQINEVDWQHTHNSSYGIVDKIVWVRYSFENISKTPITYSIFLPFHHINKIDIYHSIEGKDYNLISQTGTTRKFSQKEIPLIGYETPITFPSGKSHIILKFNHLYQPLQANTYLINQSTLIKSTHRNNYVIWFWRGFFTLAIILSIVLFFGTKQKLFLYYFFLNLGFGSVISAEIGDYFVFFEQDYYNHIINIKQMCSAIALLCFLLFVNELTGLRDAFPKFWKWKFRGLYLMFPLSFITWFFVVKNTFIFYYVTFYFSIYSTLILISLLVFLIIGSIRKIKNSLELLIIYFIYILVVFIEYILPIFGLKNNNISVYNSVLIISMIEIVMFTLIMGRETIQVYLDRNNLLFKQKKHQLDVINAIVESQELERNKVGHELHDMIGANLSIIKHKINTNDKEINSLIDNTVDLIRNLSHGLMTPKVNGDALEHEIKDLCLLASTEKMKVQYYFHKWKPLEKKEVSTHIFRIIQELLQNAIKHSQSSLVYIQFIRNEQQISIMYEDNGIGMNLSSTPKGRGLLGIENRIKLIDGMINYDSSPVHGFSITIELQA